MRKIREIRIILLILVILFAFIPILTNNLSFTTSEFKHNNLKVSPISGKIYIDGNSGWAAFRAAGNCTGNGTFSEPYVIEDLIIDGGGSDSCIFIENSDVYFRIENCIVYNSDYAGINLYNVDNGQIINNSANNNDFIGIILEYSQNINISGNIANSNIEYGIGLWYSNDSIISENTVKYNGWGISLESSNNNDITGNNANENINDGIGIWNSINNFISENNIIDNGNRGLYFYNSDSNDISGNTINNNIRGIILEQSNDNNVSENSVISNRDYGIRLDVSSDGNKIFYKNSFINSIQNAIDYGTNNQWDNGSIGNYWDDYPGFDVNDDGIGDTPYTIPGFASSHDNYPIFWDPPIISIIAPIANKKFGESAPDYNISIMGVPHTMWYIIEGFIGNFYFTELNGTINQDAWNNVTDGEITITFYAQDSKDEIGTESITVIKSIPAPPAIPGYNLCFLLGILSVVAILINKKLKKS